jgi:hypothetical protein
VGPGGGGALGGAVSSDDLGILERLKLQGEGYMTSYYLQKLQGKGDDRWWI